MLTVSTRQTGSCVHIRDKHVHCNWSPNNGLIYRAVRGNAILSTSDFFTLHCVTCDKYIQAILRPDIQTAKSNLGAKEIKNSEQCDILKLDDIF